MPQVSISYDVGEASAVAGIVPAEGERPYYTNILSAFQATESAVKKLSLQGTSIRIGTKAAGMTLTNNQVISVALPAALKAASSYVHRAFSVRKDTGGGNTRWYQTTTTQLEIWVDYTSDRLNIKNVSGGNLEIRGLIEFARYSDTAVAPFVDGTT